MKFALKIALTILIIAAVVATHELGHAFEMIRRGVEIDHYGIGLPIGGTIATFYWGDLKIALHPILLGAYVQTTGEGLKTLFNLPYADFAHCIGGAIWVNAVTAFGAAIVAAVPRAGQYTSKNTALWFLAIAGFALVLFFENVFVLIVPFIGLLTFAMLFAIVYLEGWKILAPKENDGIIGTAQFVYRAVATADTRKIAGITAMIAGLIALLNATPVYPLDGGKYVTWVLRWYDAPIAEMIFSWSGLFFAWLMAIGLVGDFMAIGSAIKRRLSRNSEEQK